MSINATVLKCHEALGALKRAVRDPITRVHWQHDLWRRGALALVRIDGYFLEWVDLVVGDLDPEIVAASVDREALACGLGFLRGLSGGVSNVPLLTAADERAYRSESTRELLDFADRFLAEVQAGAVGCEAADITFDRPPPLPSRIERYGLTWCESLSEACLPVKEVAPLLRAPDYEPMDAWQSLLLIQKGVTLDAILSFLSPERRITMLDLVIAGEMMGDLLDLPFNVPLLALAIASDPTGYQSRIQAGSNLERFRPWLLHCLCSCLEAELARIEQLTVIAKEQAMVAVSRNSSIPGLLDHLWRQPAMRFHCVTAPPLSLSRSGAHHLINRLLKQRLIVPYENARWYRVFVACALVP